MEHLAYPLGRFERRPETTPEERRAALARMETLPLRVRDLARELSDGQLDTPYRPGGWTVRQVVHHLPDSHLNSYARVMLALTERHPTIRPYDERAWAALPQSARGPLEPGLALLEAVHGRLVPLLRSLSDSDLARTFHHPESGETFDLSTQTMLYDWHGEHHLAQVRRLAEREGW